MLVRERRHADAEVAGVADQPDQLLGVEHALGVRAPTPPSGRPAGRRARRACCGRRRRRSRPITWRSSATEWLTAVRWAIGSSVVSVAIRSVTATVRVAGGAAGAVGDRHERRPQRLQLADRLPQLPLALVGLGREELEGEGRLAVTDELPDRRLRIGEDRRKTERHAPTLAGRALQAETFPHWWTPDRTAAGPAGAGKRRTPGVVMGLRGVGPAGRPTRRGHARGSASTGGAPVPFRGPRRRHADAVPEDR